MAAKPKTRRAKKTKPASSFNFGANKTVKARKSQGIRYHKGHAYGS